MNQLNHFGYSETLFRFLQLPLIPYPKLTQVPGRRIKQMGHIRRGSHSDYYSHRMIGSSISLPLSTQRLVPHSLSHPLHIHPSSSFLHSTLLQNRLISLLSTISLSSPLISRSVAADCFGPAKILRCLSSSYTI